MKAIRVLIAVTFYLIGCIIGLLPALVTFIINLIKVIRYA